MTIAAAPLDRDQVAALLYPVMNGVVVLAFGGIVWWFLRQRRRANDRLSGLDRPTLIRDLGRADGPVSVVGTVDAGPDGPVRSPASRTENAWYRVRMTRIKSSLNPQGGGPNIDTLFDEESAAPITFTDSTGSVTVAVDHFAPQIDWLADTVKTDQHAGSAAFIVPPERTPLTTGFEQREYLIPLGATATLVGRMNVVDGELVRAEGAPKLELSARSLAEVTAAGRTAVRTNQKTVWWLAGSFLLTLVAINAAVLYALR